MASRPAQGNNTNKPFNRARPAYKNDTGPKVVSNGSVSRPSTPKRGKLVKDVANATPKVTQL